MLCSGSFYQFIHSYFASSWGSTYDMLQRYLKLKTAVHFTIVAEELAFIPLSPTELEHIKNLLKPFATVTTEFSAQSYVHTSEVRTNLTVENMML